MNSEKEKIRRVVLALRKKQAEHEILAGSGRIEKELLRLAEFREASLVMLYVSMCDEVRTESMIDRSIECGKEVAVPYLGAGGERIVPSLLKDPARELRRGAYGIMEPAPEFLRPAPSGEIDLVIVPGLAFDRAGRRVGFGGGYYDRFLPALPAARVVALAFSFQVFAKVPAGPDDHPVEKIITEKGVIECGEAT